MKSYLNRFNVDKRTKLKLLVTQGMVELELNNKLIKLNKTFIKKDINNIYFKTKDFDYSKLNFESVTLKNVVSLSDAKNILQTFYDLVSPDLDMISALNLSIEEYEKEESNSYKDTVEFAYKAHLELLKNEKYMIYRNNWYTHELLCLTFGMYESLLNKEQVEVLRAIYNYLEIRECNYNIGYNRLKALSTRIKKINYRWREDWPLFCDLHMLFGFNIGIKLSIEQKDEKIHSWFTNIKINKSNYKDIRYEQDFENEIISILQDIKIDETKNIKNWVEKPENWVSSGSSKKETVELFDRKEKQIVESNNKKPAIALSNTPFEMYERLLSNSTKEFYTIETKIEVGGKGRVICAAPPTNNLRQDYISYLIEKEIRIDDAPLFMSNKKTYDMYYDGMTKLRASTWSVPLDADKFDHNVYTSETRAFFKSVKNVLKNNNRSTTDLAIMDLIEKDYYGKVKSQSGKITTLLHGLPSGIRWTSMMGCIISITRARLVERYANEYFGVVKNTNIWTFGDDIQIFNNSLLSCVVQVYLYAALDLPVNALKNLITNMFGEFLRNIITREGNRGYAARKICSILFYKPGYNENTKSELWNETFTNIWLLGNRYIHMSKVWGLIEDIITPKYLQLEKAFGGIYGLGFYSGWMKEFNEEYPRYYMARNNFGCYEVKFDNTEAVIKVDRDTISEKLALMVTPKMHSQYLKRETVDKYVEGNMNRRHWSVTPLIKLKFVYFSLDREKYDNVFSDELIGAIVRDYSFEKAMDKLYDMSDISCKTTFDLIRKHWTKRVNYLYVTGKLKWRFKSFPVFTDNFISINFDNAINMAWSANATRKFSLNKKLTQNDFDNLNQIAIFTMNNYLTKLSEMNAIF